MSALHVRLLVGMWQGSLCSARQSRYEFGAANCRAGPFGAQGSCPLTDVRIFQPSKTAMQSGRRKTHRWMVQFEPDAPKLADPLMGWIGSADTRTQLRLTFDSREQAVAFAERNGLSYVILEPRTFHTRPKSYAENFRV